MTSGPRGDQLTQDAAVPAMSIPRLIVLHLAPGALATALFVLLAPALEAAGYPSGLAFFLAVLLVIVPWELGVVVWAGRRSGGGSFAAVKFRDSMTRREWLRLLPITFVASLFGFLTLSSIEPAILEGVFDWLPSWFIDLVPVEDVDAYSANAWVLTLAVYAIMNVFVGPAIEELYFRGYLLPRMSQLGQLAPFVNAVLFSLYHFWSPWSFLSRVAGVAPFVYAVWWKRNIYLGMAVHMLLNALSTTFLIVTVAGRLS